MRGEGDFMQDLFFDRLVFQVAARLFAPQGEHSVRFFLVALDHLVGGIPVSFIARFHTRSMRCSKQVYSGLLF